MAKLYGYIDFGIHGTYSKIPIYQLGNSQEGVYEFVRIETSSGTGFLPLASVNEASYPMFRVQTENHGVLAFHDDNNIFRWTENWEGDDPNWEKVTANSENVIYGNQSGYVKLQNDENIYHNEYFQDMNTPPKFGFSIKVLERTYDYDSIRIGLQRENNNGSSVGSSPSILFDFPSDETFGNELSADIDNDNIYEQFDSWVEGKIYDIAILFDWGANEYTIEVTHDDNITSNGPYPLEYPNYDIINGIELVAEASSGETQEFIIDNFYVND